jgi:hypothetical protein
LAVANYHDRYERFPPPFVAGPDGRPWHSWRVLLLPFLEQTDLYKAYDFDEPWNGPNNRKLADRMPAVYAFNGREKAGNTTTNYLGVVGNETVWNVTQAVNWDDVTDGTGSTILVVENDGANIHWMEPRDLSFSDMDLRLNTPNGVGGPYDDPGAAMLDGSLHRLKPTLQPAVLRALLTIRGGEPLESKEQGDWELMTDGRDRVLRE